MARMGLYREAAVKGAENWKTRSMLAARTKLVNLRRDLDNQMRGLCKGLGIVLGRAGRRYSLPSHVRPSKLRSLIGNSWPWQKATKLSGE